MITGVRRWLWIAGLLGASIGLDQATKVVAQQSLRPLGARSYWGDLFRLQYSENRGAFLSLGANLPEAVRYAILELIARLPPVSRFYRCGAPG